MGYEVRLVASRRTVLGIAGNHRLDGWRPTTRVESKALRQSRSYHKMEGHTMYEYELAAGELHPDELSDVENIIFSHEESADE